MNAPTPIKNFAGNMWVFNDFEPEQDRYDKFLTTAKTPFVQLIESLILHDEIVIPTQDFMSLSALIGILGEGPVIEMLEAGILSFVRVRGAIGYQYGKGIHSYGIKHADGKDVPFVASVSESINWALDSRRDGLNNRQKLEELVLRNSEEIVLDNVLETVRNESYKDILASDYLQSGFPHEISNLDEIPGIEPNSLRIYSGLSPSNNSDAVDLLLQLTSTNLEFFLAEQLRCNDSSTAHPVHRMINAKLIRIIENRDFLTEGFGFLKELSNVPDIGAGVLEGELHLTDIIALRHTRNGELFRRWFHENCKLNNDEIAKAYVALLNEIPKVNQLEYRILRFGIVSLIGLIPGIGGLLAGLGLGVIDSFFLERVLRGESPKYFLDGLAHLDS